MHLAVAAAATHLSGPWCMWTRIVGSICWLLFPLQCKSFNTTIIFENLGRISVGSGLRMMIDCMTSCVWPCWALWQAWTPQVVRTFQSPMRPMYLACVTIRNKADKLVHDIWAFSAAALWLSAANVWKFGRQFLRTTARKKQERFGTRFEDKQSESRQASIKHRTPTEPPLQASF